MQYIIITLLSIGISTLFIYLLTNRILNVQLKIKPLILCASCALLINIVLPRIIIGFNGMAATLGIVIFIIAFAYSIAYYNAKCSMQEKHRDVLNPTPLVVQVLANQQDYITIENHNLIIGNSIEEKEEAAKGKKSLEDVVLREKQEITDILELSETVENFKVDMVEKIDITEIRDKEPIVINENNNKLMVIYDDKDAKLSSDFSIITDTSIEEEAIASSVENKEEINLTAVLEENMPINCISLEPELLTSSTIFDAVDKRDEEFEVKFKDQFSDLVRNDEIARKDHELELPIMIVSSAPSDLESLMDFAFMQKEQRDFTQALITFRHALALYPSSEAAPFLVMEIGTILKNNGQYDEAISVFHEARKLPGLQKSESFELEFIKTIAYLRIVKNMLLHHHLNFIPINDIPDHILQEIDAEFREWRSPM